MSSGNTSKDVPLREDMGGAPKVGSVGAKNMGFLRLAGGDGRGCGESEGKGKDETVVQREFEVRY